MEFISGLIEMIDREQLKELLLVYLAIRLMFHAQHFDVLADQRKEDNDRTFKAHSRIDDIYQKWFQPKNHE